MEADSGFRCWRACLGAAAISLRLALGWIHTAPTDSLCSSSFPCQSSPSIFFLLTKQMSPIYGSRRTHHKTKFTFTKMAFLNFHTWCRPKTTPISGNCTSLSPKSPLCLLLGSHLIWRSRLWLIDTRGRVGGSFTRALFQRRLDGKMTDGEFERSGATFTFASGHMLQKCLNI